MERERLHRKVHDLECTGGRHAPRGHRSKTRRDPLPAYIARDGTDTLKDNTSPWKEKLRSRTPMVNFG
eukprot:1806254-Pyramimonas_sp.AAC.1